MINGLFPPGVVSAARTDDVPLDTLFEDELAVVRHAVPRRRAEYATVRWVARKCLAELGHKPVPLLAAEPGGGAPCWPNGYVGALTHCAGYRAAAVARASMFDGVGIDAEPAHPLPDLVLSEITSSVERDHLNRLALQYPSLPWGRLLFSAKESYYKVWFPAMGCWLGFDDVEVRFLPLESQTGGGFTVRPCSMGSRRARRNDDFDAVATGFPALPGRWCLSVTADSQMGEDAVLVTGITAGLGVLASVRRPQTERTATGTLR